MVQRQEEGRLRILHALCLLFLMALAIIYPPSWLFFAVLLIKWIEVEAELRGRRGERLRRLRQEAFRRKLMEGGLVSFVDRYGVEYWGTPEEVEEWRRTDLGNSSVEHPTHGS